LLQPESRIYACSLPLKLFIVVRAKL